MVVEYSPENNSRAVPIHTTITPRASGKTAAGSTAAHRAASPTPVLASSEIQCEVVDKFRATPWGASAQFIRMARKLRAPVEAVDEMSVRRGRIGRGAAEEDGGP